ncbi:restriction endonuclease subunit S [Bilifractor sp. LCP19S3_H10]|uniref:restriction endonuclease subunit S n=1 Tax=Bilifractor sp. LCP19S3_H10 TaxID=3438736 RepID=UPI003F8DBC3B
MKYKHYYMEDALEDIIDYRGKTPHKATSGIQTLSAKSVKDGYIDYSNCYFISLEEYNRFMVRGIPKTGDVLLTTEAPLGNVARLDREDVALAQRLLTLRGKQGVLDTGFLYYYLRSPIGQAKLREKETGTTVTGIKQSEFRRIEIDIPSYSVQKKIVDILCHLDQKMELNRKINKNLEAQAQAYFIDQFVVNADPTWPQGTLSDLGTVVGGGTPSKKHPEYYCEHGIPWITPKDLSVDKSKFISHGENDISDLGFSNSSATKMPEGTILFSSRAPIGYIAIASNTVTTNQGFKSVIPNTNIGTAFVYYFLKQALPTIEGMASGSTFKEISGSGMKSVHAVIPDNETLHKFSEFCKPLFKQQAVMEAENRRLSGIRDALLPKLMSGEIDVSDIDL